MQVTLNLQVIEEIQNKILSKTDAYIDLCFLATYSKGVEYFPNKQVIPIGYLFTSTQEIAKHWGWAWGTTNSFLEKLEQLGAISIMRKDGQKKFILQLHADFSG